MTVNDALLAEYVHKIEPHLELAKKAFGSRSTVSPQHDASREYTRLLCEYYNKAGSLLAMAEALGVTYAGLRRRVTTANLTPSSARPRKKFPQSVYDEALVNILAAKNSGVTHDYHLALWTAYDSGLSLAKIAAQMGLSSANPLYYAIAQIELENKESASFGHSE